MNSAACQGCECGLQSSPLMMWPPPPEAKDPEGGRGLGAGSGWDQGSWGRGHGLGTWLGLRGCGQDWGWSQDATRAPKGRDRCRGVGQVGGGAGSKNRTKVLRAGVGEVSVRGRDQYFGGCYGA